MGKKHPNVVHISEVELRIESKENKFGFKGRRLGPQVGAKSLGCSYFEIEPGFQAFPHHFHSANEEATYVLEGTGTLRIGKEETPIEAGDYISFPVGPDHAHSIKNTSKQVLKLLAMSTQIPVEIVGYPDSKKIGAVAMADSTKGLKSGPGPWVRIMVKEQPNVDYYEGEL
jgi:uncharacterized cupin superfamily protein